MPRAAGPYHAWLSVQSLPKRCTKGGADFGSSELADPDHWGGRHASLRMEMDWKWMPEQGEEGAIHFHGPEGHYGGWKSEGMELSR